MYIVTYLISENLVHIALPESLFSEKGANETHVDSRFMGCYRNRVCHEEVEKNRVPEIRLRAGLRENRATTPLRVCDYSTSIL